MSIESAREGAFHDAYFLLACEIFEAVFGSGRGEKIAEYVGEEVLIHECLMFVAAYVVGSLNSADEENVDELVTTVAWKALGEFELMSLLDHDDLEAAVMDRFESYPTDSQMYSEAMGGKFSRAIGCLKKGEHFSDLTIRYEDPIPMEVELDVISFCDGLNRRIYSMISVIDDVYQKEENCEP